MYTLLLYLGFQLGEGGGGGGKNTPLGNLCFPSERNTATALAIPRKNVLQTMSDEL